MTNIKKTIKLITITLWLLFVAFTYISSANAQSLRNWLGDQDTTQQPQYSNQGILVYYFGFDAPRPNAERKSILKLQNGIANGNYPVGEDVAFQQAADAYPSSIHGWMDSEWIAAVQDWNDCGFQVGPPNVTVYIMPSVFFDPAYPNVPLAGLTDPNINTIKILNVYPSTTSGIYTTKTYLKFEYNNLIRCRSSLGCAVPFSPDEGHAPCKPALEVRPRFSFNIFNELTGELEEWR